MKNFLNYFVDQKYISHNEDYSTVASFDAGKSTDLVKLFIKILKKRVKLTSVNDVNQRLLTIINDKTKYSFHNYTLTYVMSNFT